MVAREQRCASFRGSLSGERPEIVAIDWLRTLCDALLYKGTKDSENKAKQEVFNHDALGNERGVLSSMTAITMVE